MLGYKVSLEFSEILMTHGGNSLETWKRNIKQADNRIHFAADMLRQLIISLKTLHGVGYSHGDLKPQNVCCRKTAEGSFKFTLIDFGICQKLPQIGKPHKKNLWFRGNLMFCSDMQLQYYRPT